MNACYNWCDVELVTENPIESLKPLIMDSLAQPF